MFLFCLKKEIENLKKEMNAINDCINSQQLTHEDKKKNR